MDHFLASVDRRAFLMARVAVGGDEDALDIVQDAMMAFVKKYSTRPETEWKPVFYRILQNRIKDWRRRHAVRTRWRAWLSRPPADDEPDRGNPIERMADPKGVDSDERVERKEFGAALTQALQALPLRQQQAFLLRAWEGLSVKETARAMKCTAGSVKTHYSRAVGRLRELLEDFRP